MQWAQRLIRQSYIVVMVDVVSGVNFSAWFCLGTTNKTTMHVSSAMHSKACIVFLLSFCESVCPCVCPRKNWQKRL